jgi:protein associated with RNAse G/E
LEFATEKWGGVPHYRGEVELLGEDEFGLWLWGAKGRTILRGEEPAFIAATDTIFLVPRDAWWSATWWLDHPEVELYVNIGTLAVVEAERIVSTDLDLDVIRRLDGTCEVLDRDEFEEHQVRYGYPLGVIDEAEAATAQVVDLVTRGVPPFDAMTASAWVATVR